MTAAPQAANADTSIAMKTMTSLTEMTIPFTTPEGKAKAHATVKPKAKAHATVKPKAKKKTVRLTSAGDASVLGKRKPFEPSPSSAEALAAEPKKKKLKRMLTEQDLAHAKFWVFEIGMFKKTAAALLQVGESALRKALKLVETESEVAMILQTPEQVVEMKARVKRVTDALIAQRIVRELVTAARLDVLVFPGTNHSEGHLQILLALISRAKACIDVSMYVITHERLVQALLEAKSHGRVVRVVIDNTLKNCVGSRVKQLYAAGIPVYVHRLKSYMHHEKIVIVDNKTVVHGSVNMSEHAMASGGLMVIHEEWRFVLPVLRYFAKLMTLLNYRSVELVDFDKRVICASCKKSFTEFASGSSATTTIQKCVAGEVHEDHGHDTAPDDGDDQGPSKVLHAELPGYLWLH